MERGIIVHYFAKNPMGTEGPEILDTSLRGNADWGLIAIGSHKKIILDKIDVYHHA
jgi:hypothetical protein